MRTSSTIFAALVMGLASSSSAQELSFAAASECGDSLPATRAIADALGARERGDDAIQGLGNPTLTLMPGFRATPGEERGLEVQASYSQPFRPGVADARRAAAASEREELRRELALTRRRAQTRAELAWIDLWEAERLLTPLTARAEDLAAWRVSLERAMELGAATRIELGQLEASEAELRASRGEQEYATLRARGHLRAACGLTLEEARTLRAVGAPPSTATFSSTRSPGVALAEARVVRAERQAAETEASNGLQVSVGVQVQADQAGELGLPEGVAVFGTTSLTFPLFEQGQRAAAQAHADAARERNLAEGVTLTTTIQRETLSEQLEALERRRALLRDEVLPAHESLVASFSRRRELGAATVFEELAARRALTETQTRIIRLDAELARVSVRLQSLWEADD